MKNFFIPIIILSLIFVWSCQEKENPTGIKTDKKILTYNNIVLKLNKDTLKNNKVEMDKELIINIEGLDGFTKINEVVFIGCFVQVTDEKNNPIVSYKDLYSYYDVSGITPQDIKDKFSMTIGIRPPMAKGGIYKWKSRIWDKKGDGELNIEFDFKVRGK
ncbi:MAG: hypothetical protein A2275_08050 [Bacteroidetes bacterium RIFOXYA12_FULL_35_11]|nr:MAG: hypothetical protein A2X01_07930 [Bacteroidetes bacterium GWF2_35_48]OFY78689.1 MAG: hypothetical protein A2275_08050 [Bacteroidetes bacterium RIFOXYA12_FULL_35_11]OFY95286.1 MAG: hypothetical protein A2491_03135 [Bacteroidetes bacterium RIFOXYC12_FULL_35_7]HBX53505.1 hypothetical protein [Bacteroidales bacterium]